MHAALHVQFPCLLFQRGLTVPHAAKQHMRPFDGRGGGDHGFVVLSLAVLAHGDEHGVLRADTQPGTHRGTVHRPAEARKVHPHAADQRHAAGGKPLRAGIVLAVDGDEQVGPAAEQTLRGVVQQPVFQRRAGEKMKPVRRIDHARAAFARRTRRQTAQQPAHRRVAMDKGVVLGVDELLQAAKDLAVGGGKRRAGKGQLHPAVAIRHLGMGIGRIVGAAQMHLVALFLKPAHIGQVKHQHMHAQHRGHKQHLSAHVPTSVRRMVSAKEGSSSGRNASLMFWS